MPHDHASKILRCFTQLTYLLTGLTLHIILCSLGLKAVSFPLTPARIHLNQPRYVVWLSWVDICCLTCLLETNPHCSLPHPEQLLRVAYLYWMVIPSTLSPSKCLKLETISLSIPLRCLPHPACFILHPDIHHSFTYRWSLLCVLW